MSEVLRPFKIIRRFDFSQSQIASNLTKFVEKKIFSIQHKFIMKIYLIVNLMKLI